MVHLDAGQDGHAPAGGRSRGRANAPESERGAVGVKAGERAPSDVENSRHGSGPAPDERKQPVGRHRPGQGGVASGTPRARGGLHGWPLHVSPWVHYATILAIAAALVLGRRVGTLRERVIDPYIWEPIVHDLGFNPVNTALFAVVLLLGVLWWYRLLHHYPIELDRPTVWSGLLVFFWGIVLRVFHDAQLIAPFDAETACIPGRGALMGCAGVFFVTPILWLIVGSLLFPFGRLGIAAQQVAARRGRGRGLLIVAAGPLAIFASSALLLRQPWTQAAPDLWWVAAVAAAGWLAFAWHAGRVGIHWSHAMLMQVLVLVAILLQPLGRIIAAGVPHPASLWAVPVAAGVALLAALQARRMARRASARPGMGLAALVYLVLLQAAAGAAAVVAVATGRPGLAVAWLVAAAAGAGLVWWWRLGGHPALAAWAGVPGAYILAGHLLDAYATGVGLDLFHASEKHVLPRLLVHALEPVLAGTALAPYPGFTAMLLYKVPVALFAAWALHVHGRRVLPPDLLLILQMVVATVGAAPGFRNALRQALGV